MSSKSIRIAAGAAAFAVCNLAAAHPGHAHDAAAGLLHPLLGADHLLAMLAVGVWACQLGGRARWLLPASFLTLMALAGGAGMAGIALPMVEGGIAASLLALGLLIAFSVRLPAAAGAGLTALFAIFHGYAHGAEMPAAGAALQYAFGFLLSTAVLHGCGLLLGAGLRQRATWLRAAGLALAAGGAWMMAA